MAGSKLSGDELLIERIPNYESLIVNKESNGLAGEIIISREHIDFFNPTGVRKVIERKNCLELDNNNSYRFDRSNLLEYLNNFRNEYIYHDLNEYKNFQRPVDDWKNISLDGWEYRKKIYSHLHYNLNFDLYLKVETESRYYIGCQSADCFGKVMKYTLIPNYTNIRVVRNKLTENQHEFIFYLEPIEAGNEIIWLKEKFEKAEAEANTLSDEELYNRAKEKSRKSKKRKVSTSSYSRDPEVSVYVKRRAKGKCDLCGDYAPFENTAGEPYLEEHHVVRLADGGDDSIDNALALCPNCHRKMHIINLESDIQSLMNKLNGYKSNLSRENR